MGRPAFPAVIRPGLERARRALALLGHPEETFASVLIAGTNGKGSVSAMVERVLRRAGYRTGHFTSPHLVDVRERVRVDGTIIEPAPWNALQRRLSDLRRRARLPLTEFEAHTVTAFRHFADRRVEVAVVEVGMGGRLDATNALPAPEATVITSIGLDHTRWLGRDLPSIYAEKRGIARAGTPLLQHLPRGLGALSDAWDRRDGVPSRRWGREIRARIHSIDVQRGVQRVDVTWPEGALSELTIPLFGAHQAANAALAVATLDAMRRRGWRVREEDLRWGLAHTRWRGRFDILRRRPPVVLDGAHNPPAAEVLARTWREVFGPGVRATVILAGLKDKDVDGIIRPLRSLARRWVATGLSTPRGRAAADVARALKRAGVSGEVSTAANFSEAWRRAGAEGPVLITGSLYLVGEAMTFFRRTP
jgi:dihydrofolate synthase/folylpolyglutamate synthase